MNLDLIVLHTKCYIYNGQLQIKNEGLTFRTAQYYDIFKRTTLQQQNNSNYTAQK